MSKCRILLLAGAIGGVALSGAIGPSSVMAAGTAELIRLRRALRNQLSAVEPRCNLTDLRYDHVNGKLRVLAVVLTPRTPKTRDAKRIEALLRRYVDPSTILVIRIVIGADVCPDGYLSEFDDGRLKNRTQV